MLSKTEEINRGPRLGDGHFCQVLSWSQGDQLTQQADIQAKANVLPADTWVVHDSGNTWSYASSRAYPLYTQPRLVNITPS